MIEFSNNSEASMVMALVRRDLPEMAAHLDAVYSTDKDRVKAIRESIEKTGRA